MRNIRHSYLAFAAVPLLFLLSFALARPPAFEALANFVFDSYQRLQPRIWSPASPVRIIDIDDESLARIGQWPWPRTVLAELVDKAASKEAATIAFDIVFSEPDRLSPERLLSAIAADSQRAALQAALSGQITNDAAFAKAMAKLPVVLGSILTQMGNARAAPIVKAGFAHAGDDPQPWVPAFSNATEPLPIFAQAAAGIGALNWLPGRDQVIREVPLVVRQGTTLVPSLAAEALRTAQAASTISIRSSNASGQTAFGRSTGINAVKIGAFEIDTGPRAERRIHFSRTEPGRFIPAWKLLAGDVPAEEINGRILLVGTSAAGLLDQRATPIDRIVAGVEVHAQLIEHVAAGGSLARPDWAPAAEFFAAVALAIGVATLAYLASPIIGALVGFAAVTIMLALGWFAFSRGGVLLDPIYPSVTAGVTYLSCLVELFRHERRQKAHVKEAFGRFVSPAVVDRLATTPSRLVLGGESRELTLLFCDLRDFTGLSEGLSAEQLTAFMNDYLTPMTDVILAHDGTIDKYMGDAVMAFWNAPLDAPDHARQACLAALAMSDALVQFNRDREVADAELGRTPRIAHFGVGLNTGLCSVGNLGSIRRFDYSAIGDPVNVASRLDGLTKFYGAEILATEETRSGAADLAWLDVDEVRVKGRSSPTRIYLLAGGVEMARSTAFGDLLLQHNRARDDYRQKKFDSAAKAARALGAAHPLLQAYYARFAELCDEATATPDWSAVRNMADK
jgi:adenylate cyclase